MVTIKEVVTKKDIKTFVRFPHSLYKGNPYYVPPFEADEVNRFNPKKNESYDECEVKCFLAYRDEKVVGRIAAIIQKSFNEKSNSKRSENVEFPWMFPLDSSWGDTEECIAELLWENPPAT